MSTTAPASGENAVGSLYDQLTDALSAALGDNIHFGYWDDEHDDTPIDRATDRLTDLAAERLAPADGMRVLDVGCGSGRPAVRIADRHRLHVTGVSISEHQIKVAQDRPEVGDAAGQVAFQLADATDLPFADGSFDGAYAIESLVHMADKKAAVDHVGRVLRPGARFVAVDFFLDGEVSPQDAQVLATACGLLQFAPLISREEYRRLLDESGLELVEFTDIRANIARSYRVASEAFHQALRAMVGGELGPEHRAAAQLFETFGALPPVGYALITAVRR
ncbi:SAM-dependent methyltransferase [Kitasatospora sp. NPDC094028]